MNQGPVERIALSGTVVVWSAGATVYPAAAQDLTSGINNLLALLNGPFILAAATLAILVVGLLWMFGRLQLLPAITIVMGVCIAGSAATIAGKLVGGT